jgi:hypothetical protein
MNQPWDVSERFGLKNRQFGFRGYLGGHENILTIKSLKSVVMVQFEARLVSGHAFRHAAKQVECAGFSRCAVTSKPRLLKPLRIVAFGGIAEAMP